MFHHYLLLKSLHLFGVILFLGNIIVTAFWKVFADLSKDWQIIAFSQRMVTYSDILFTTFGVIIISITGLIMAKNYGDYWHIKWIHWGLSVFIVSGMIWITILLPIQVRLHHIANKFNTHETIPVQYWLYEKLWIFFGIIATILPLSNLYLMVFKPT